MRKGIRIAAALLIGVLAVAASPYRDQTGRSITSLSPEKIEPLRSGAGAGYALPAELNGYPGPRHVLDLAGRLDLTEEQRRVTRRLFDAMRAEAVPLGEELIAKEAALDTLFRKGHASEAALLEITRAAASVEARLRATHLKYHLRMATLLTPHQRVMYNRLRGYGDHSGHPH